MKRIKPEEVVDHNTLFDYAIQNLGIPMPTHVDKGKAMKQLKKFFAFYPNVEYDSWVHVVEWAKTKKKKFLSLNDFVGSFRFAYMDGWMPELDNSETDDLEDKIQWALTEEKDPEWRRRFIVTRGDDNRAELYQEWLRVHRI